MGYKRDTKRKREKTLQKMAFSAKKKHDQDMKGKKVILVPHPELPRTWIEKTL